MSTRQAMGVLTNTTHTQNSQKDELSGEYVTAINFCCRLRSVVLYQIAKFILLCICIEHTQTYTRTHIPERKSFFAKAGNNISKHALNSVGNFLITYVKRKGRIPVTSLPALSCAINDKAINESMIWGCVGVCVWCKFC